MERTLAIDRKVVNREAGDDEIEVAKVDGERTTQVVVADRRAKVVAKTLPGTTEHLFLKVEADADGGRARLQDEGERVPISGS